MLYYIVPLWIPYIYPWYHGIYFIHIKNVLYFLRLYLLYYHRDYNTQHRGFLDIRIITMILPGPSRFFIFFRKAVVLLRFLVILNCKPGLKWKNGTLGIDYKRNFSLIFIILCSFKKIISYNHTVVLRRNQ